MSFPGYVAGRHGHGGDADLFIPAKIFEYVRFHAAVLALTDTGSATELLLRDMPADVVEPDDVAGIVAVLTKRYRERKAGVSPQPVDAAGRLSRRFQADLLFEELDALLRRTGRSRPTGAAPDARSDTEVRTR